MWKGQSERKREKKYLRGKPRRMLSQKPIVEKGTREIRRIGK